MLHSFLCSDQQSMKIKLLINIKIVKIKESYPAQKSFDNGCQNFSTIRIGYPQVQDYSWFKFELHHDKTCVWGFQHVQHKWGFKATYDGKKLEILDLGIEVERLHYVSKTRALISCAVTAQLINAFVFAYAKGRFSHDVAHLGL